MRKIFAVLACLLALSAQAQYFSAPSMSRTQVVTVFNGTSPATPSTGTGTAVTGLDAFSYCFLYAKLQGATGGPLDVYVQTSYDSGTTWIDVGHYTQLAAAAALVATVVSLSRWGPSVSATPTSVPTTVNSTSGTPVLAANTFLPGVLGNALRVVLVAGALTTAGATQVITAYCAS